MATTTLKYNRPVNRGVTLRGSENHLGGTPPVLDLTSVTTVALIRYQSDGTTVVDTIDTAGVAPAARLEFGTRSAGRVVIRAPASYVATVDTSYPLVWRLTYSNGDTVDIPATGRDAMSVIA